MSRLNLKNNFDLCYPILEKEFNLVYDKINSTLDKRVLFYELRIDYLLENNINIDHIIVFINDLVKKIHGKKFIVTIRTKSEGGVIELSYDKYCDYINKLIRQVRVEYIDIEYKYYELDKEKFDVLIENSKTKVILSRHEVTDIFSSINCERIIRELFARKCDTIKLAMMVNSKEDLFSFMNSAKKSFDEYKEYNKNMIFIAMGEMGRLSRIYPEYTNTHMVFLNAYDNDNKLGQFSLDSYLQYRKLLAKEGKN